MVALFRGSEREGLLEGAVAIQLQLIDENNLISCCILNEDSTIVDSRTGIVRNGKLEFRGLAYTQRGFARLQQVADAELGGDRLGGFESKFVITNNRLYKQFIRIIIYQPCFRVNFFANCFYDIMTICEALSSIKLKSCF